MLQLCRVARSLCQIDLQNLLTEVLSLERREKNCQNIHFLKNGKGIGKKKSFEFMEYLYHWPWSRF